MCYLDPCTNPGIWQPILNLKSRSNGEITLLRFKTIRVCDGHKKDSTVNSFLSDEGFDQLSRRLRDAGKSIPIRKLITLAWEKDPIREPDAPPKDSSIMISDDEALPF
jgi:hypothetical protein